MSHGPPRGGASAWKCRADERRQRQGSLGEQTRRPDRGDAATLDEIRSPRGRGAGLDRSIHARPGRVGSSRSRHLRRGGRRFSCQTPPATAGSRCPGPAPDDGAVPRHDRSACVDSDLGGPHGPGQVGGDWSIRPRPASRLGELPPSSLDGGEHGPAHPLGRPRGFNAHVAGPAGARGEGRAPSRDPPGRRAAHWRMGSSEPRKRCHARPGVGTSARRVRAWRTDSGPDFRWRRRHHRRPRRRERSRNDRRVRHRESALLD